MCQRCGDVELAAYLTDASGTVPIIITHYLLLSKTWALLDGWGVTVLMLRSIASRTIFVHGDTAIKEVGLRSTSDLFFLAMVSCVC